jgi:spermidine/putrescine transport system substrate-binding protein
MAESNHPRVFKLTVLGLSVLMVLFAACSSAPAVIPTATTPPLASSITFYSWASYMPQDVLDAFTKETGVKVNYVTYDTQEQAIQDIQGGKSFDVVVIDDEFVPRMVNNNLLATIDYANIPNFKNISPNFRDLAYDSRNQHSVPYHWGTTGLLVRTDLVKDPVTSWSAMWDTRYAGKVAIWAIPRTLVSATLKSLGYSINSEDPDQLKAVENRLLDLKRNAYIMPPDAASTAPDIASGKAVIALGWSYDWLTAKQNNQPSAYVIPKDGTILWGDNFVIPANSPNRYTAEVFINFLLRDKISAQIVNESYYAVPNDAARAFISPDILNDPSIYPPADQLKNAEIELAISPSGQKLWDKTWDMFLNDDEF